MLIKLHANAVLTPAKRAYVQSSNASVAQLAHELGVGEGAIRRWKQRQDTADRSSRPRRLQTRFTPEEEQIVAELRTRLRLSLDDILEVMRRCVRHGGARSRSDAVSARPSGKKGFCQQVQALKSKRRPTAFLAFSRNAAFMALDKSVSSEARIGPSAFFIHEGVWLSGFGGVAEIFVKPAPAMSAKAIETLFSRIHHPDAPIVTASVPAKVTFQANDD